jgi:hypothetical protein
MKAEETYGQGGYTYLGNGEFEGHGGLSGQEAPCKLALSYHNRKLMSSRSSASSASPASSTAAILRCYSGLSIKERRLKEVADGIIGVSSVTT